MMIVMNSTACIIMREISTELFSRLASASTEPTVARLMAVVGVADGIATVRVVIGASSIRLHFYAHHFYLRFL